MGGLKSFLFFNDLSQLEVAEYLGVSRSYMSRLVSGTIKLRPEHLEKLMNNDKGWNTEYLSDYVWHKLEEPTKVATNNIEEALADKLAAVTMELQYLREQNEKLERTNQEYWKLIMNLTAKKDECVK